MLLVRPLLMGSTVCSGGSSPRAELPAECSKHRDMRIGDISHQLDMRLWTCKCTVALGAVVGCK